MTSEARLQRGSVRLRGNKPPLAKERVAVALENEVCLLVVRRLGLTTEAAGTRLGSNKTMEAVSLAFSVAQVVDLGISTIKNLRQFAKDASNAVDRVQDFADFVEANSRIIQKLNTRIKHEPLFKFNANIWEDVQGIVRNYEPVYTQIDRMLAEASGFTTTKDGNTKKSNSGLSFLQKIKWPLLYKSSVAGLHEQLNQYAINVLLILVIHWKDTSDVHSEYDFSFSPGPFRV